MFVTFILPCMKQETDIYQYELDDGTEIHDTSLPFTTTCPYMPGQPVNLLSVPVEVHTGKCQSLVSCMVE